MFGLKPEDASALAAIAKTFLPLFVIVANVVVAMFVYFGTKRIAKAQFAQTLSAAWIAYNTTILNDDKNIRLMNAMLDKQAPPETDLPRKRWLGFLLLNPFAIAHSGIENKLIEPELLEQVRSALAGWLSDPEIYQLSQTGVYPPAFAKFCHELALRAVATT